MDSPPDAPAPGAAAPTRPVTLETAAALEAFLETHDRALVVFHTEGCGACAAMEPVVGGVARTTAAAVAWVNPRDDPVLVERFDVRSVPLLVAVRDGTEVGRRAEGFLGAEAVLAFLEEALGT